MVDKKPPSIPKPSKSTILLCLTVLVFIGFLVFLAKNFITTGSIQPARTGNIKTNEIQTSLVAPKEGWTPQEKVPEKLEGIAVGKNNNINIGEKGTFFSRRSQIKDNTKEILTLLGYKTASKKTGQANNVNSNTIYVQLSPIIAIYSNWDENPNNPPKIIDFQGKPSILVSPSNSQKNKSTTQTLSSLYLVYQLPPSLINKEISIDLECRQIDIKENKGEDQSKVKPQKDGGNDSQTKPKTKPKVKDIVDPNPPTITARFLNHNFYFKSPFSAENKRLPKIMASFQFKREVSPTDNFLMVAATAQGDQSIIVAPSISVSEVKKTKPKKNGEPQRR